MAFGRLPSSADWADWLTLSEVIERIGPQWDAHWTGSERAAPSAAEQAAEIAAIFRLKPQQLAAVAERWGIEPPELTGPGRRRRGAELRERIAEAIECAYAPAEPARWRWRRMRDLVRAKILSGELRVGLRMPDCEEEPESLSREELAAHFPAAGEDRIRLPRLGNIPALLLIHVDDADRAVPAPLLVSDGDIAGAVDRIVSRRPPASGSQSPQAGTGPRKGTGKPTGRGKPGPKTQRTAEATAELLRQLTAGRLTPEDLLKASALSLANDLTARGIKIAETAGGKARTAALAQFRGQRNSEE